VNERKEMRLLIHGERLEKLLLGAGFIDIKVREIKFEIGVPGDLV
jgi:hypothetical protein